MDCTVPFYCPWIEYVYKTYHSSIHMEAIGEQSGTSPRIRRSHEEADKNVPCSIDINYLDCILDKEFQVLEALDKSGCKISELNMVVNQNNDFGVAFKELCNHVKKNLLQGAVNLANINKLNQLKSLNINFVKCLILVS